MLVSVIIPSYNRARYVGEAVRSVLEQEPSGCEVEVIVVDDGSTDDTRRVLAEFGDRIVYRRIENSGRPAVPRNVGLGLAKGELIAFQDSDDRWAPDKLKQQLPVFEDAAVMVSYGNAATMNEAGVVNKGLVVAPEDLKSGQVFDDLLVSNFISTLTVMMRREMFDQVGRFDESQALRGVEDYQLWLRMALVGKFAAVPQVLAHYRQHEGNISDVPPAKANRQLIDVYGSLQRLRLTAAQARRLHDRLSGLYEAGAKLTSSGRLAQKAQAIWHRWLARYFRLIA